MTLTTQPSIIIRDLLIANGLGSSAVNNDQAFPIYVTHEPDDKKLKVKDDILTIYDTAGSNDGRIMKTGEQVQHEGVQVRVRAREYLTGYARAKAISDFFDGVLREPITVDSIDYTIQNISRTSTILPLGTEKGTKRRQLFTVNVVVTIEEN